jgi:HD-GYP domain-containing protein (c-di-GMP phosphodiesterase class II)
MESAIENAGVKQVRYIPGFSAVPTSLIRALRDCRCDLYRTVAWSSEPALYCTGDAPLTDEQSSELSEEKIDFLYIRQKDSDRLHSLFRENLENIVQLDDIPLADRYHLVRSIVNTELKRLFQLVNLDGSMGHFARLSNSIFHLASSNSTVPAELLEIARHNPDTFTHVVNVSAYCVLVAECMGISDDGSLKAIAMGGLLHDVGKRFMPRRLLNKETAFDEKDKKLIRTHPQKGYEELCRFDALSHGQLMMAYQHHEWVDGRGYPVGITSEEIHPWAKICAVADVFEALTGKRPYRKPEPVAKVIDYLIESAGRQFDGDLVERWSARILAS